MWTTKDSLNLLFVATSLLVFSSVRAKRFKVVSYSQSTIQLYSKIKMLSTSSRSQSPAPIDVDRSSRKKICRDITSSPYFARNHQYPIKGKYLWFLSARPSVNTEEIEVSHPQVAAGVRESVFVCKAMPPLLPPKKYYVSPEYDLKPDSYNDDHPHVTGRFVFHAKENAFKLYALAEHPAEVFFTPDYGVEQIYLRRKKVYAVADRRRRDPMCRLEEAEKVRICLAVFGGKYFRKMVKFSSFSIHNVRVQAPCKSTSKVSFQTDDGKIKAVDKADELNEWMIACTVEPSAKSAGFDYLLSQAYEPNQIFVYLRDGSTGDIFLETLVTNARLNVFYPFRMKMLQK